MALAPPFTTISTSPATLAADLEDLRMLRIGEVCAIVRYSRAHIYRLIGKGEFPPGIPVGPNRRVWPRSDIVDFLRDKPPPRLSGRKSASPLRSGERALWFTRMCAAAMCMGQEDESDANRLHQARRRMRPVFFYGMFAGETGKRVRSRSIGPMKTR